MHRDHHLPTPQALARWLEAEAAGRDTEAEAALGEVFRALPLPAARAGFADRVMCAVAVPAPAIVRVFPLWLRAAIAACLALAGVGLATLPTIGVAVGRMLRPAEVLTIAAGRLVAALDWLADGLSALEALHGLREAVLQVLGAPPVAGALLVTLLISALGFRRLTELLAAERSLEHASPNG